jgi:hypothetical protein
MTLSPSTATGSLGVMHLKRYWEKEMAKKDGTLPNSLHEEFTTDTTLLNALGLGLEQTIKYLFEVQPGFNQFEQWILDLNQGHIARHRIDEFNALISGKENISSGIEKNVLTQEDLAHWDEHGYVIIPEVISRRDCQETINAICEFLSIDINDPATWYHPHPAKQGIMIQLFQHPRLEENRRTKKIRAAYEELWGRTDLWVSTDRVSFNPPQNEKWTFPGPRLHWDVSLELPIPFGLQGLLYLSDTTAAQGAFTLVPGFQHKIDEWINSLAPGTNPRTQDLYALGATPIAANAGDFIIWHQALPHGSSPNTAVLPRIVQYINYAPLNPEVRDNWK